MVTKGYGIFSPEIQMASDWGANAGLLTLKGEWWRIISSIFLHYGVLHLVLNMNALFVIGPLVERFFGSTRFFFLYFYSGIMGGIVSLWHSPLIVRAGASGAIFGLIGGMTAIAFIPKLRPPAFIAKMLISSGVFFVVVNSAIGLSVPFIDNAGHFGGLIGGAITGMILASSPGSRTKNEFNCEFFIRLLIATLVVFITCYFLLLDNTKIENALQVQQSATLYEKARTLVIEESYIESMNLARRASDLGDIHSPNLVGYLFARGLGIEADPIEAAVWFKLGADRGDPFAMMNLYHYYNSAKPVGVDLSEINNLLLAAAKKEHFPAHSQLEMIFSAFKYVDGEYYAQQITQIKKAIYNDADANIPGMIALKGWILYYGYFVPKDRALGLKLLHNAYDIGAGRAGEMLGRIYRTESEDQPADLPLAQKFFETGAQKGDPRAQYQLAIGYRDGLGTSIDIVKASNWFKRAAEQAYSPAKDALKKLEDEARSTTGNTGTPGGDKGAAPPPETVTRTGKIISGPNKGKTVTEFSDGTQEIKAPGTPPSSPSPIPQTGDIKEHDGKRYEFKGGDPNKKSNWKEAK